jgi:hypothetical protein
MVRTQLYNFYSAGNSANADDGDEVLELRNGPPTAAAGVKSSNGRYAWQKQETHKGRFEVSDPAGTSWAGWGFWNVLFASPSSANAALPVKWRDNPVFRRNPSGMFSAVISAEFRNELLAKGVPALSPAVGHTAVPRLTDTMNFNMNTTFKPVDGAWGRNGPPYNKRWLHSDMKGMAFFYTHALFESLVQKGGL